MGVAVAGVDRGAHGGAGMLGAFPEGARGERGEGPPGAEERGGDRMRDDEVGRRRGPPEGIREREGHGPPARLADRRERAQGGSIEAEEGRAHREGMHQRLLEGAREVELPAVREGHGAGRLLQLAARPGRFQLRHGSKVPRTAAWLGALAFGALLLGCQPTAVIVTLEADEALRTRADGWSVEVVGASGARRVVPLGERPEFPREFTITPSGSSAERFLVEASLRDGGAELGVQRVSSAFVSGAVRRVRLRFSDGCVGIGCGGLETCEAGACVSACVAPAANDLLVRVRCDAGPPDAGSTDAGPTDAGPLDAGSLDAGPPDAPSPPSRTAGALLAYDFATTDGASTPACLPDPSSGLSASAFALALRGATVEGRGTGGGDLVLTAPGAMGEADPGIAALQRLFEDPVAVEGVDGFTIEAWVTWPEVPSDFDDLDSVPVLAVSGQTAPPSGIWARPIELGLGRTGAFGTALTTVCAQQNGTPTFRTARRGVEARVHIAFVHRFMRPTSYGCEPGDVRCEDPRGSGDPGLPASPSDVLYVNGAPEPLADPIHEAATGYTCSAACLPTGARPGCVLIGEDERRLTIGGRLAENPSPTLRGRVHLVAVYDRPLADDQLRANFLAGPDADPCVR